MQWVVEKGFCLDHGLLYFLEFFFIPTCRLLGVGRLYLSVVLVCYWLLGVGCLMLIVDCRMSLSVVVAGC